MLIPYNVDRPIRRTPYFTYGLIGINVFVFLMAVFIGNLNLPTDRVTGVALISQMTKGEAESAPAAPVAAAPTPTATPAAPAADNAAADANAAAAEDTAAPKTSFFGRLFRQNLYHQPGDDGAAAEKTPDEQQAEDAHLLKMQSIALGKALEQAKDANGYIKVWQIKHAYASFVSDPHYTVLNTFAYHAAQPKIWGLIGSLFIHGGFWYLLGDVLFLWVFGRALEEEFGPAIYVGAYLLCGIAATLTYHVLVMMLASGSAALPLLGAPGAMAGMLGLCTLRFYRTPVRMVQIVRPMLIVGCLLSVIVGGIGGYFLGSTGVMIGFFGSWAAYLIYSRGSAWEPYKATSAWIIGAWLLIYNVLPCLHALTRGNMAGVTAYLAYIAGFGFGLLYALLLGSKSEGALEYALEDAHKAYDSGQMESAIERANNVLSREPNNSGAYEVLAKAYDQSGNEAEALDNYEIAIQKHFQAGEREAAVNTYLHSLSRNPGFILDPKVQMALGSQMARMALYQESAENLAKIPFTFPESPEGELALLRSAQVYLEQLNEPDMAAHLLHTMLERYPDTQWLQQVERNLRMAQFQLNPPEEAAPAPEVPQESASTRVQAQLPQIKR